MTIAKIDIIKAKLKKRVSSLWKRTFRKTKAQKEEELKVLSEEIAQLINRSNLFKSDCIIASAEKIIKRHLENDPRAIIAIAENVLQNVAEHVDIEIAANPVDSIILSNSLHEISLSNASSRNLTIIADEAISRGSLVLRANKSIIDANISTEINQSKSNASLGLKRH